MTWTAGDGPPVAPDRNPLKFKTLARLAVTMRRSHEGSGSMRDAPAGEQAALLRERERVALLAADEEGGTSGLY